MSHHLRWSAAAVLLLGLSVGAAQQLHLFTGNDSTPLPPGEAERRYDASTSTSSPTATSSTGADPATEGTPAATPSPWPLPGVYSYATTGGDSIDALTGAHHEYPATTTITVLPTACGIRQRWDVLEQRWEEWQRCVADERGNGVLEVARTNYDEFFGQSQTDTWECTGAPRPLVATAGATWTTMCTDGSTTDVRDGVVVGIETQTVAGDTVDTLHVRVTVTSSEPTDRETIDTWYLAGTDLVVVQTADAATSNDSPVGTVHYVEQYSIHLTSLTPRG